MALPARCDTHGVVLTSTGACLLCERRAPVASARSGRAMTWLLVSVVSVLLASAVAFRVYGAVSDRRVAGSAMRSEPISARAATTPPTADGRPTEPGNDPQGDHERRVAEARRSLRIDLYGAGWCPSCRKARSWLDSEGIGYTYRDTTEAANKQSMRALNPRSTIPTIDIEGQVLVGFDAQGMRTSIRRAAEARVAKEGL